MTDYWPFENDADRNDPLTEMRIAVTSSHPGWRYLVAFDHESEARPTDAEARMLASYLDEYKHHWYGGNGYQAQMEERALDVDGGANGVIFHKWGDDDWGFRRQSFTRGWLFTFPSPGMRDQYANEAKGAPYSLERLMDFIHTIADDKPMQHWLDWKASHSDAFAGVA